jgi:hypothetical protein
MEEYIEPPLMIRHHQNNLEHVRKVYLSVLFSTPTNMWSEAIEKLNVEVIEKLKTLEFVDQGKK